MKLSALSPKQLVEIEACTRCGECLKYCPVYAQRNEEEIDPRGKIQAFKSFIRSQYGLWAKIFSPRKLDEGKLKKFSEMVYRCTLCGECSVSCPVSIDAKHLWTALRETLVEMGHFPEAAKRMKANVLQAHNVSGDENEERTEWLEFLDELPDHQYKKKKAEVAFFVGCVASFFPLVQKIPLAFVEILNKTEVDFTLLGGEEWCCGFPLIGAGMKKEAEVLIQHNLEMVKEKGVKSVVFACPSCYHTWMEEYKTDIEIFHSTQFIKKLIDEGKITFKEKKIKVTYHDPCDLGRASGVYEAPREILRSIPGVELIEMENNREQCKCCGGGGNLEMVDPDLSAALAQAKIDEIQATGADTVITACQQCVRTILTTARRKEIPINAMDITEFVLKNMKS
jgi:heterodisulfide reductase subunit D